MEPLSHVSPYTLHTLPGRAHSCVYFVLPGVLLTVDMIKVELTPPENCNFMVFKFNSWVVFELVHTSIFIVINFNNFNFNSSCYMLNANTMAKVL